MKAVSKEDFFRQVTIRICSSLHIQTALKNVFEYMKDYLPLDEVGLAIRDEDLAAIRLIGNISTGNLKPVEEVIPVAEDLWERTQSWNRRGPIIINSIKDRDDVIRELLTMVKYEPCSDIFLPLRIEEKIYGFFIVRVKGEGMYSQNHAELLGTISEPIAIALANALAHEKLLSYRDVLLDDNSFLKKELHPFQGDEIIGENSGLRNVLDMVRQVAPLNNSVLILGETGTGKEVIANAIHFSSPRKNGPLIKVNCGAIPETLIDSELFGHEKGAFTGATIEKRGRFERANGGTIFLDEIGELPQQAQVRLLRVLQYREIDRVGGSKPIKVDIRVIAATHRNLEYMVSENKFREDLWFRLNVFPIVIPPLRQRKEDIPSLVRHFVARKSIELGIAMTPPIAPGTLQRLMDYNWPGNVRELENLVEREIIQHRGGIKGQLMFESLPHATKQSDPDTKQKNTNMFMSLNLDEAMSRHISSVLEITKGKIHGSGGAAELLGIKATTLRARMDKLGIKYGRKGL